LYTYKVLALHRSPIHSSYFFCKKFGLGIGSSIIADSAISGYLGPTARIGRVETLLFVGRFKLFYAMLLNVICM